MFIFIVRISNQENVKGKTMFLRDQFEQLKDQEVEINCNGIVYKGRLVGASEDEVHLQTPGQFLTIRMTGVSLVKKSEK